MDARAVLEEDAQDAAKCGTPHERREQEFSSQ
jgi:hypothetical protein